jgi:hypothetical protein
MLSSPEAAAPIDPLSTTGCALAGEAPSSRPGRPLHPAIAFSQRWRMELEAMAKSMRVNLGGTLRFAVHGERRIATAVGHDDGERIAEQVERLGSEWASRGTAPFGLLRHGVYRPAEQQLQKAARDLAGAGVDGALVDALRDAPRVLRQLELSGMPCGEADLEKVRLAFEQLGADLRHAASLDLVRRPRHAPALHAALEGTARTLDQAMQRFQQVEAVRTSLVQEREALAPANVIPG